MKYLKKIMPLIVAFPFCQITPIKADFQSPGFKYGAGIGMSYLQTNMSNATRDLLEKNIGDIKDLKKQYILSPTLLFGYQFANGLYLGFVGAYNHSLKKNIYFVKGNKNISATYKGGKTTSWSALAKVGYQFQAPFMVYGLAGINHSKWRRAENFIKNYQSLERHLTKNKATGFTFGGGVDYQLNDNFILTGECTVTNYKSPKTKGYQKLFGIREREVAFTMRVSYMF